MKDGRQRVQVGITITNVLLDEISLSSGRRVTSGGEQSSIKMPVSAVDMHSQRRLFPLSRQLTFKIVDAL